MATSATIGKWGVTVDSTAIEEVISVSGLGKTNDTIEVTNFDSDPGTKEYIGGLAEGSEITIECNYIHDGAGQAAVIAAVDSQSNVAMVLTYDTTAAVYTFQAAAQGWTLVPAVTEQNKIEFTFKISGAIVIT